MSYHEFYESVLPGNYALTKSMELRKERYSGTLWYTKKFLVLYYYIFLNDDIHTQSYIEKVKNAFDLYIDSLDPLVREEATKFFYPENTGVNFKSNDFIKFSAFAAAPDDRTRASMNEYFLNAKKLYFALLMGSGGQSGVKRKVKEIITEQGFIYSKIAIDCAIKRAVIEVCVEQLNRDKSISDNSINKIISTACINKLIELSHVMFITEKIVEETIREFGDHPYKFRAIENDLPAFIRNERQVLYYFGYFHSKTSGANDIEFSSLTPVGELALTANNSEFLAIWEHQKLKMISQPVTVQINKVPSCVNSAQKFAISFTPYTDILGHLLRNGEITTEQYKYVVSRRKHTIIEEKWILCEQDILGNISSIKSLVNSFGRSNDMGHEDCNKELTKYILGIQGDLRLDCGTHIFSMVKKRGNGQYITIDSSRLRKLYEIYIKLENYKQLKFDELFNSCEESLKQKYISENSGNNEDVNPKIKISWDLYNIRVNEVVLLGSMIAIVATSMNIDIFNENIDATVNNIFSEVNNRFDGLLKKLGYNSDNKKRKIIKKIIIALKDENWSEFDVVDAKERYNLIETYREISSEDLFAKLEDISIAETINFEGARVRNSNLIKLLKSYYMHRFMNDDSLQCECCRKDSFMANNKEPYVEFHHLIPFSIADGPDHYLNLFALCPDCHRKIHFMAISDKRELYNALNSNNHLHKDFTNRLIELKRNSLLKSYHLEYLLAEEAISSEDYLSIAG